MESIVTLCESAGEPIGVRPFGSGHGSRKLTVILVSTTDLSGGLSLTMLKAGFHVTLGVVVGLRRLNRDIDGTNFGT